MSMSYEVFLNDIDDSKIQEWISELNKLGMDCEVHPEFSFKTQQGFLPFKIKINENSHEALMNKEYLTGFEYYIDRFDVEENMKYKEQSFFQKLLRKPKQKLPFHSKEIDQILKDKKYVVLFNFGIADTFELRMASLASATLTKIADGVCCYSDDDLWYDNGTIIENALKDVAEYEKTLKEREFRLHEFEEWQ
jgi:hypothetical protein